MASADAGAQAFCAAASDAPSDDDVDTDEPPGAKDVNDTAQDRARPAAPVSASLRTAAMASACRGLLPSPPIKPPPVR